jgi:hypothetical protein
LTVKAVSAAARQCRAAAEDGVAATLLFLTFRVYPLTIGASPTSTALLPEYRPPLRYARLAPDEFARPDTLRRAQDSRETL